MSKRRDLLAAAVGAVALASFTPSANAQLTLLYTFEDGTDTTIENFGSGPDGTLSGTAFSFTPGTPSGNALTFTGDNNTFVNTNAAFSALVGAFGRPNPTAGEEYTMTAVVSLSAIGGDSMIFGQDPNGTENALHNGFREAALQQGHWGADTSGGAVTANTRYHVAYRYSDTDGNGTFEQQIFLNGASVAGPNTVDGIDNDMNILIGTSRNNGGLTGTLDNVRIYSNALSNAEIASLAQSDLTFVPEPATASLLALGAGALVLRRRRRA